MPPFMGFCGIFSAMTGKKLAVVSTRTIGEEGLKSSFYTVLSCSCCSQSIVFRKCLQNFHWDCIFFFLAAKFCLHKISWKIWPGITNTRSELQKTGTKLYGRYTVKKEGNFERERERLQSILLMDSSDMSKYSRISSYIRKLFLIHDFSFALFQISLISRNFLQCSFKDEINSWCGHTYSVWDMVSGGQPENIK